VAALKEQLLHSNTKLDELTSIYETTKQSEIEEKNKTKHLERSVRALKIEKDQLFTVSSLFLDFSHLVPTSHCRSCLFFFFSSKYKKRPNLQAKRPNLQRKLAVQEFAEQAQVEEQQVLNGAS